MKTVGKKKECLTETGFRKLHNFYLCMCLFDGDRACY